LRYKSQMNNIKKGLRDKLIVLKSNIVSSLSNINLRDDRHIFLILCILFILVAIFGVVYKHV